MVAQKSENLALILGFLGMQKLADMCINFPSNSSSVMVVPLIKFLTTCRPAPQGKNSAHHSTPRRSAPSATTSSSAPSSTPSRSKPSISVTVAKDSSFETQCVLASCQSLAFLDGDIVGDPLEKVSVKAIDWTLDKSASRVCV